MKLHLQSVVRHQGRESTVDALVVFRLGTRTLTLARLGGPTGIIWLEPPEDDLHERAVFFRELSGLDIDTPAPAHICYEGIPFVSVLVGRADATVFGPDPGRTSGPCELWRYRGAGDRYLHIERWPNREIVLEGTSVHQNLLEIA